MLKKQIQNDRIEKNLKVLKLLSNNDPAISEEQKRAVLNTYSGWGGLREAVFTPSIYGQLKRYLTDDEISSVKKTVNSAYYTPDLLVKFIWAALVRMGFNGLRIDGSRSNILEPAAGTGIFFNHMPQIIARNANIDAIELDNTSCKLFSKLHQNINIINTGFENFCCNDSRYDLIIGNPPYGRSTVNDIFNQDLSHLIIHHFFVAKSAKMLRNKGIIAMILPQFFLDNVKDHARDIINTSGANLILACRLPDSLFLDAKITVDLVFLQKTDKIHEWQATRLKTIGEYSKPMNEYFFNNPHHVLGKLEIIPMYERMGITCKSSGDLRTQLATVYSKIKKIL